jgi:hypothetical protein
MPSVHPKIPLPLPLQGIRPDVDDFHIPPDALRSTSYNWMLDDGKIVTRPGFAVFANDTGIFDPIRVISYTDHNNTRRVVHSTTQRWWHYDPISNQWQDISDGALLWSSSTDAVQFRVFNSSGVAYLLGVNQLNTPRAWDSDPAHDFTLFGGSAPVAGAIAIVADRVLLGDLGVAGGGTQIDVSGFQTHAAGWGITQTTTLVDTPGRIVTMLELGATQAAVYKTDAIYLASGNTGLAPIRFDLHSAYTPSPASPASVLPLSQTLHAIFTWDGELYLFDGATFTKHPSSDSVRQLFEQNAELGANVGHRKAHAYYNSKKNELRWYYTRDGLASLGPRDAISINLSNGSVWKLNYNKSAFSFSTSYYGILNLVPGPSTLTNEVLLGSETGQFYREGGNTDAGTGIDAMMETGLSDLGDATRYKTIEETEHYFGPPASTQTPTVQILLSKSGESETVTPDATLTVDPAAAGPYVTGHRLADGSRPTSRFLGIRIQDDDLSAPLEYRGSSVLAIPRGSK